MKYTIFVGGKYLKDKKTLKGLRNRRWVKIPIPFEYIKTGEVGGKELGEIRANISRAGIEKKYNVIL